MDNSHYQMLLNQLKKSFEPGKSSKMFVNPHFRQSTALNLPNRVLVNPNFAGSNSNNEKNALNKIHFNPRFVHPHASIENSQNSSSALYSNLTQNKFDSQSSSIVTPTYSVPSTSSNTRYKFIRHASNSSQKNSVETVQQSQVKALIKVGKYKITKSPKSIVPVVRRNLLFANATPLISYTVHRKLNNRKVDNRKVDNRKLESRKVDNRKVVPNKKVYKHVSVNKIVNIHGKKFSVIGSSLKLISASNSVVEKIPKNLKISINGKIYVCNGNKSLTRKEDKIVNKLKKNNVPCPAFRKQGKCMRQMKGICQYVHDRKHVILCGKFLKGACCDLQCLLSHELSKMKMPTCSFYLQGSCTRENCPYLHVKLNDKADICQDFLKGYCEKGEDCNKRHTYIMCPDLSKSGKCVKRLCPYPHKRIIGNEFKGKTANRVNGDTTGKSATCILNHEVESNSAKKEANETSRDTEGNRYFVSEHNSEKTQEVVEYVKHKLGTLPSFIKL